MNTSSALPKTFAKPNPRVRSKRLTRAGTTGKARISSALSPSRSVSPVPGRPLSPTAKISIACAPLGVRLTSTVISIPSPTLLRPKRRSTLAWSKMSERPCGSTIKPNPLVASYHFTWPAIKTAGCSLSVFMQCDFTGAYPDLVNIYIDLNITTRKTEQIASCLALRRHGFKGKGAERPTGLRPIRDSTESDHANGGHHRPKTRYSGE